MVVAVGSTNRTGVIGLWYDDDEALSVGDSGGGGDEQDDEADDEADDDDDDEESVLSVKGVDGERGDDEADGDDAAAAADPFGWIELSLCPRCVMRLAPKVTSKPGVAARHRDTSEAQRV